MTENRFHYFRIRRNDKLPSFKGWQEKTTCDPAKAQRWLDLGYNIGIFSGRYGADQALVVVDIDVKHGKRGYESRLQLELDGFDLPETMEQTTPTGGRHLIYTVEKPMRQGTDVLGNGLDIRSRGGYIVAAGSTIDGKPYMHAGLDAPVPAPQWLIDRLGEDDAPKALGVRALPGIDTERAYTRAAEWLATAPGAIEGDGGDIATYKTAAKLKDFGCDQEQAKDLMLLWNDLHCEPPWPDEDLFAKIDHAYRYGREPQGSAAPEAVFSASEQLEDASNRPKMGNPLVEMNKEFAFVKKGCFILQETTDDKGSAVVERLNMAEFKGWFANKTLQTGRAKPRPLSDIWTEWPLRREYDAVKFAPERDLDRRFYNLWKGFKIEPLEGMPQHPALDAFLEHARINVCQSDEKLFRWLMGYFAHLIQKPWEKPLVALVFKGEKGTGKNALVERVGYLLGQHFMVVDDERYILSNFNAHLESSLFLVLDEASWAGDKKGEGKLKGLITGLKHNVERKGQEAYQVDNLTRVAIIGNEDWLVPATQDERRFAVFQLGEGRKQDRKFFRDMRVGMEQGGYAHLLRYLLDFDLTDLEFDAAPCTKALVEQKHQSLQPVEAWWFECLTIGKVVGGDWGGEWPLSASNERLHSAFSKSAKGRNVRGWLPNLNSMGCKLAQIAPSYVKKRTRSSDGGLAYERTFPGIDQLRKDWERHIGSELDWETLAG